MKTSDKYTAEYWCQELKRSREDAKFQRFLTLGKESELVYEGCERIKDWVDVERKLNIWKYVVETLLPAYYSRAPKVEVKLRKERGSSIAQASAFYIESFTQSALDEFFNFNKLARTSALSILLVGRSVIWPRYSALTEAAEKQIYLKKEEDDSYSYEDGQPYVEKEEEKIYEEKTPESSTYLVNRKYQKKIEEKVVLENVHYTDFLQSISRTEDEIEWKSRRAFMSRENVTSTFGKDAADSLTYNAYPEKGGDYSSDSAVTSPESRDYEGKAEIYEVWCEPSGKTYYVQVDGEKKFIESEEAPVKYHDFYPCSVFDTGLTLSSTVPVSDYATCRDQIMIAEQCFTRADMNLRAIRPAGVHDPILGDMLAELYKSDLVLKPAKGWPQNQSGNMSFENMIAMLPTDPYVKALEVMIKMQDRLLQQIYETTKASDILRGSSMPYETATAVQLKSDWSSMGLKERQTAFADHLSCGINRLSEVLCQTFDKERLIDLAGPL